MLIRIVGWFERLRRRDRITLFWQAWAWFTFLVGVMGLIASGIGSIAIVVWLVPSAFALSAIRVLGDGQVPYAYAAPRILLAETRIVLLRVGRIEAESLRRAALATARQVWERDHGGTRRGPTTRRDGRRRGASLRIVR